MSIVRCPAGADWPVQSANELQHGYPRRSRGPSRSVADPPVLGRRAAVWKADVHEPTQTVPGGVGVHFGPHLGNYEVGSPDLEAETMRGLEVSFRQRVGPAQGAANFYVYDIDNFIFGDLTDEIADNLRVLDIRQGDSRFVGFDARGSFRLGGEVWATLGLGYVDATLTTTGAAAAHTAATRHAEPGRAVRWVDDQPGADVRGAAGPDLPRRDRNARLFRRQPGRVLHLAAAARGARAVVHRLQRHQRALPEPHVVHQGPGPRDGPRDQGGLLAASSDSPRERKGRPGSHPHRPSVHLLPNHAGGAAPARGRRYFAASAAIAAASSARAPARMLYSP